MTNGIRQSMEGIKASEDLKRNTLRYVEAQREKRSCKKRYPVPRFVLAAACLLLFFAVGGYSLYKTPVSYISIDVNPSVELGVNRFGRVVSAEGFNEDGKNILEGLKLMNLPYLQAIERLLENERYDGFLNRDSQLFFTVISKEPDLIMAQLGSSAVCQNYESLTYISDEGCRKAAHQHEMSFGKYRAYLELAEYDGSITVEDCQGMTMLEIQNRIDGCKSHGGTTDGGGHSDGGSGHGGHHGH